MNRALVVAWLVVGLLAAGCSGAESDETDGPAASTPSSEADTTTSSSPATSSSAETGPTSTTAETAVAGDCPAVSIGTSQLSLDVDGVTYNVRVHVPEGYTGSPDAPAPVVINWHGLGSDGFQQATYTGYDQLAETEGFLSVHPTGPPIPGSDQNAWDLGVLTDEQLNELGVELNGRDDLAMAGQLIDTLTAEWCGDENRVYSTGLSNGGFFTVRLICEMGDRIAAAVVVAGLTHPDDCEPAAAVPLLAYHGTDDEIVPYEGAGDRELPPEAPPEVAALFDQTIAGEFAQFAETFGCDTDPQVEQQSPEVTAYRYTGCDGGRFESTLFEIQGGGHTWPGSALGLVLEPLLGKTTFDVDATADGWAYMGSFSR